MLALIPWLFGRGSPRDDLFVRLRNTAARVPKALAGNPFVTFAASADGGDLL
jgi:hypothetical protein